MRACAFPCHQWLVALTEHYVLTICLSVCSPDDCSEVMEEWGRGSALCMHQSVRFWWWFGSVGVLPEFKKFPEAFFLYYCPCKWQYCFQHHQKHFVNMITHELLHLAWWNFPWTCTSTTSRTLLNIKVIGQSHRFFVCFLCAVGLDSWNVIC